MKLSFIIKNRKNLTKKEMGLMNKWRIKEFGREEIKDFKRDYPPVSKFFFAIDKRRIVAFEILIPVKIKYLGKRYNILGLCSFISIKKGKGYGKALVEYTINYLMKTGKTGLGFTGKTEFAKKSGLNTEKNFIRRFVYRNPKTKEEISDNDGEGIYYEGKDGFVSKVLSTKSRVYISIPHW